MTEPTDDQIRMAVAKAAGWTLVEVYHFHGEDGIDGVLPNSETLSRIDIPNFPQSIDAIRAVVLREDEEFQRKFAKAMTVTALVMHCWEHSIPPNEWCLIYLELKGVKL